MLTTGSMSLLLRPQIAHESRELVALHPRGARVAHEVPHALLERVLADRALRLRRVLRDERPRSAALLERSVAHELGVRLLHRLQVDRELVGELTHAGKSLV